MSLGRTSQIHQHRVQGLVASHDAHIKGTVSQPTRHPQLPWPLDPIHDVFAAGSPDGALHDDDRALAGLSISKHQDALCQADRNEKQPRSKERPHTYMRLLQNTRLSAVLRNPSACGYSGANRVRRGHRVILRDYLLASPSNN